MSQLATDRTPRALDHLLGAALAVAYIAWLLLTVDDLGLSRDESMYVHAADSYGSWYQTLFDEPSKALSPEVIAKHFRVNREHPALAKTLFAFSHMLDEALVLFPSVSTGYRFVGMVSAGLLLWLLYVMGFRYGGRAVGLFAAAAYALLPRPFYHAHLNCFDVPITLAITWTVFMYQRSLHEPRYRALCGFAFGVALATKHNSWVLPGIFAVHFAFVLWAQRRSVPTQRASPVPRTPHWLLWMVLLGPVVLVGTWPYLWHDGLKRFGWYAAFHLRHDYYNMAYFGRNYFEPPFPVSFPWVMTLFTVPLTTLALVFVGLWREGTTTLAQLRSRAAPVDPSQRAVLWLGCALAPLLMISLPSSPIFGGTKHWMTAYPFLCLFAGVGLGRALHGVRQALLSLPQLHTRVPPVLLGGLLFGVLLTPAAIETVHSHPFGLSHYGVAAGGVPGAADLGMNREFWGYNTGSLVTYLNNRLPRGGRVFVCDTTAAAFRQLATDGLLRRDIHPTAHIASADIALVHLEHHFAEVEHQIWSSYGTTQPSSLLLYDGVPIMTAYENPRSHAVAQPGE